MIMAYKQQINSPVLIRQTGKKPKKSQKQQHYFVQSMPGVGAELAQRLLAYFNSIEEIVLADINSFQKVEGIGKVKAAKLYEFFRMES